MTPTEPRLEAVFTAEVTVGAAIEAGIESFAAAFEGAEAPAMLAAFRAGRR